MLLLEILGYFAVARCFIFWNIFIIFTLVSLEIFVMIFDVRIFTMFKKKNWYCLGKYLLISDGIFLLFKKKNAF